MKVSERDMTGLRRGSRRPAQDAALDLLDELVEVGVQV